MVPVTSAESPAEKRPMFAYAMGSFEASSTIFPLTLHCADKQITCVNEMNKVKKNILIFMLNIK